MARSTHDIARSSLQMSEYKWNMLIATLEAGKGPEVPATRDRRDLDTVRYPFVRKMALRVQHPGGTATSHLVRSRNLSRGGVGFLHGQFLYPNTVCYVVIPTRWGENVILPGRVSWCRHVSGQTHEVGMRFDQVIQVDEFLDPAASTDDAPGAA
ncbi:MAG: PilZ domain-containing protein [Planctomycetota bacterium]